MRLDELDWRGIKSQLNPYLPMAITLMVFIISGLGLSYLAHHDLLTIDRPGVVIRQEAMTNAKGLANIEQNQSVALLKEEDGWLKVRYDGHVEGWIPKFLLDQKSLPSDQELTAQFDQATQIYPAKKAKEETAMQIPADTYLTINYIQGNWAQLTYQGQPAYVPTQDIQVQSTAQIEEALADKKQEEEAEQAHQKKLQDLAQKVYLMQTNEVFYQQADSTAGYYYQPDYQQEFKLLEPDFIIGADGLEYFKVEDLNGTQGYLKYASVLEPSYSLDHRSLPKVPSLDQATILLDPGHGGEDPGTLSSDQSDYEKNYTLPIAQKLKTTLEALGAKVLLTRDQDQFLGLEDRVNQANQLDPDLFISLHFDSSWDTSLRGTTSYFYHMDDEHLAQTLNTSLKDQQFANMGVAFGNYYILRENHVPAVLLELGFISNDEELDQLQDQDYQQDLADAISKGIVTYFKQVQTLTPSSGNLE